MKNRKILLLVLIFAFYLWGNSVQAQKFEDYKAASMGGGQITSVHLNKTGSAFATGNSQGTILVRDLEKDKLTHILKKHTAPITSLAFHPFGIYLASTSTDGSVLLWDLSKGMQADPIRTFLETDNQYGGVPQLSFVYFNEEGDTLYYGGSTGKINAINPFEEKPTPIPTLTYEKPLTSTAYDAATNTIAIGNQTHVRLVNVSTQKEEKAMQTCSDWIVDIAFSTDGKRIACLCKDGNFTLVDRASEQIIHAFKVPKIAPLSEIALSPDGKYVAMATTDNILRTWELATQQLTNKLRGHQANVRTITFTSDSKMILSGGEDRQVKIWKWRKVYENEEIPIREKELEMPETNLPKADLKPTSKVEEVAESLPKQSTEDTLATAKTEIKLEDTKKIVLPKNKLNFPREIEEKQEEVPEKVATIAVKEAPKETPKVAKEITIKTKPKQLTSKVSRKGNKVVQAKKKLKPSITLKPSVAATKPPIEEAVSPRISAELNRVQLHYNSRNVPDSLGERRIKGTKRALIKGEEVTLEIWDDQHEDGDIVSLYFNGKWVLKSYLLKRKRKKIRLKINKKADNYLLLYAHNEGTRPPNTAALNLFDGHKERRINLSSTLKSCEGINIKYYEK